MWFRALYITLQALRKRIMRKVGYIVVFLLATLLAGCTDKKAKELDRLLVEVAGEDATVDGDEWNRVVEFLDRNKAHFGKFYDDGGELLVDEVKQYVSDLFARRRPPMEIDLSGAGSAEPLAVHFYLERSGSMLPYDAPQGDGSLKSAVVQLLNSLPGDATRLYVVNDAVHPYPQGTGEFIRSANVFESTKGIGDASYTDFSAIFSELLGKTGRGEVGVLVSDLIYSTKAMTGVNPQKIFADAQGMIQAVFKDETRSRSMLVVKLNGSYHGPYYAYDQPRGGTTYNGRRPYYIVVVGDNAVMRRLTTDANYSTFSRFASLPGYEGMALFAAAPPYSPYYSLLLSGKDLRGRFSPERGQGDRITVLEDVRPDADSGDLRLALAVDLSGMLIDENYLTNPDNYEVESGSGLTIKAIRPVTSDDATPAERRYLKSATHIFVLQAKEVGTKEEVTIRLKSGLPPWVEQSSTDDDRDVAAPRFAQTTFGLKYLLRGIGDAYARHADKHPAYFEMKLKMKR